MKYEIRIEDGLDDGWTAWFDGMHITNEPDGVTVITGQVADQAALHGLLAKVRDLGLELLVHAAHQRRASIALPKERAMTPIIASEGLDHALAIETRQLTKTYPGGVEAVKGIDLAVPPGEVFGLLGPNGAGKSTTVGMLTTTIAPTSGRGRVAGFDVATHPIAARRASAVVFQEPVVDRGLTGRRNLDVHARLWGLDAAGAQKRIAAVVEPFGLGEVIDRPVDSYSGGQRRRLEIARALISEPQVLFLDEPTVGLDPRFRFELLDLIAGLRAQGGMTILLTTHYLDEAEQLCDRVAIVHHGRIVALDSPAALLAHMGRDLVELRLAGDVSSAVSSLRAQGLAGDDTFAVGATLHIPLHDRPAGETVATITDLGLGLTAITSRAPTLDDVYLQLTGESLAA